MSELKLEVGKRYETRRGIVALVESVTERAPGEEWEDFVYRVVDESGGLIGYHREDGRWINTGESGRDLIREITESEPAPPEEFTPPEFVEAPTPLQLEVGKSYRRRDGRIIKITRFDADETGPWTHEANNGEWFSPSGVWAGHNDTGYDGDLNIAEEIPAPVAEAVAEMEFEADPRSPGAATDTPDAQTESLAEWFERTAAEREAAIIAHVCGKDAGDDDAVTADHFATTRADRFATYCRAILFVMLGVAAMTFATRATARELLSIPNNAGGEIILTDTPSEHCDGSARLAISRAAGGKTIVGCWVYSDAGYVYVKWGDDLRLYKLTDFRVIEQFNEQSAPPPTDHRTPWRGA